MDYEQTAEQPEKRKSQVGGLIVTIFVFGLLAAGYWVYYLNPCSLPITYSIGNIDPKFKISESEVKTVLDDAASRWNKSANKNIYYYDPDAKLKINLVYDERQQKLDETKAKIAAFDSSSGSIEEFRVKVSAISAQYEKDLSSYNNDVNYWNSRGGAPEATFNQLNSRKAALDKRRTDLNRMADLLNLQIDEHNGNVASFNEAMQKDANKIITEGEYYQSGDKINIYTYGNKEELRLVLMHEMGHALSTEHDTLETSILYPILDKQDLKNPLPSAEDLQIVSSKCRIN